MKALCFRHGESLANAGLATSDPVSIPLTDKGMEQAQALGNRWITPPALIASSPFLRALQTAAPLQQKFPDCPFEIWPIHEFTYLSPQHLGHSTPAERMPLVEEYWEASDPFSIDGEGAESFAGCMTRVADTFSKLESLYNADIRNVVLFGHGQFFLAMSFAITRGLTRPHHTVDRTMMQDYRRLLLTDFMENGSGLELSFDGAAWRPSKTPPE